MEKVTPIKQAVILAGGQGTRLRPLTDDRPKPMVLVNHRPFAEYLVDLLKESGITEVVFLLGYLPESVMAHFGDGARFGIKIKYSVGTVEDETGTRLKNARPLLQDKFLLLYTDNYWPMNLSDMFSVHEEAGTLASVTVYNNKDSGAEYGSANNICVSDDGYILKYSKERQGVDLNGVDIGFFILDKRVLDLAPDFNFSFEREILPVLIQKRQLTAYRTDYPYYWLTTTESLKIMEDFLFPKKVIFLDRDGVINKPMPPREYVRSWEEFEFLPGALDAIAKLTRADYQIYVVTNQQGISRGVMDDPALTNIHRKMVAEITQHGGRIADIYYCPHGDGEDCDCRKPKPGLLFRAAREHKLDLTKTILIGDSESDRGAGEAVGCRTIILGSGEGLLSIVNKLLPATELIGV